MAYIKKMVMHGFKSFAKKTEVFFDRGINVVVGPNGSGKCLTEEVMVQLADGSTKKIGELVNEKIEKGVRTEDGYIVSGDGTKVMCLDLKSLKIINKPVKAFVKRTSPSCLLKIKTKSGKEIKSTKYHPFFILKGGNVVPAKAEELRTGVRIAVPRVIPFEPEHEYFSELLDLITLEDNIYVPYSEDILSILKSLKENLTWQQLAKKIGIPYYTIKGLMDGQAVRFAYLIKILKIAGLADIEIINIIQEIRMNGVNTSFSFKNSPEFSRFFGYVLAEGRLAESSSIWFTNGDREIVEDYIQLVRKLFNKEPLVREYKPNCWDVIVFSEPLKIILAKMGMASKTECKYISNIILKHSSNEEIANLLNGLYCGDGYVSNKVPTVEIVTKSDNLARGIETCLLRLGMLPRTRKIIKKIKSYNFTGEYNLISLYGVEMLRQFDKYIKLKHSNKQQRIKEHLNKKSNPNVDLIEVNEIIKLAVKDLGVAIKPNRQEFPRLESYCYNECMPSRNGLQLLLNKIIIGQSTYVDQLQKLANSDIFWDEIEYIEEIPGVDWVYDLSIEEEHNFIANNIIAHNSNVSDALCFALGRLSIKSMRAAKAKNLLFMGSKYIKPSREAVVELVFDNLDRAFPIEKDEIVLQRSVKYNGQSAYRINGEVKTRIEIIETLARAGIDPYGFNLILQGKIQEIIKMHPEERRKIIEEVAGIAIYESRKEKSLKELEKTDERLKEINSTLRERTAFLRNLDRERAQALRFKELEMTIKRAKATILTKRKNEKDKELESLEKSESEKAKQKEVLKGQSFELQSLIDKLTEDINQISKHIQQATGLEQESLHTQIANLKAEIEGIKVRKEGYENRMAEVERRVSEMRKSIPSIEKEIKMLREESPKMAQKSHEIKAKKDELAILEEEKDKILTIKSELGALRDKGKDREQRLGRVLAESESIVKSLEEYQSILIYRNEEECAKAVESVKRKIGESRKQIEEFEQKIVDNEKKMSVAESEILRAEKIKKDIVKIDICPLCQSKMTAEHIAHVDSEQKNAIENAKKIIEESKEMLREMSDKKRFAVAEIHESEEKMRSAEMELMRHRTMRDKHEQLKRLVDEEKILRHELVMIENKRKELEEKSQNASLIEEKYESKMLEIEEISSRTIEDTDTRLLYKQRELEQMQGAIKISMKNIDELKKDIHYLHEQYGIKNSTLNAKEEQEKELQNRFKKLFEEREETQRSIQERNVLLGELNNNMRAIEDQINYLKIGKAKIDAEREALQMELNDYSGIEIIQGSIISVEEKLQKSQQAINEIGSINLRALEVYEEMKSEYDKVQEKAETINKEKQDILAIISEIDTKKKRSFMKTFRAMSDLFSQNFSQLYTKGIAFLELENKEDIFAGGVNIVVRLAKGKYFDVTSLSGGEQTLVALSLLFAIQEYKPYHFYVLDEIDAALDKRNSERLATLLVKYMKSGQYIIVTHNDAIIMSANLLYGISMHDGVSKILSLNLEESLKAAREVQQQEEAEKVAEQVRKEETSEIIKQ